MQYVEWKRVARKTVGFHPSGPYIFRIERRKVISCTETHSFWWKMDKIASLNRAVVIVLPSCKIGKVLKMDSFCFTCTAFLTVEHTLNVCARKGDQLENVQENKQTKKRCSVSESIFFKQPESEDSQCFIICSPAVEYCLLKCTTMNLVQNCRKFVDLHNAQFFLWLSLNVYWWWL